MLCYLCVCVCVKTCFECCDLITDLSEGFYSQTPPVWIPPWLSGFLRTQGCHRPEETSPLSEDAYTRSPCHDSILVMKGQVSVKPTSAFLIADKMVPAVRARLDVLKYCC
jgi:hypothetical protein